MKETTNALNIVESTEPQLYGLFKQINDIAYFNQKKVLKAFQNNQVSMRHFANSSGYGYDDTARDTLCKLFADVFACEKALVSPLIASGTHALSICLFGILRPNDTLLSISGAPYDTLKDIISGENIGSLKDFNINYQQVDLLDGDFDYQHIAETIAKVSPKMVFLGRSRGYSWRNAMSIAQIEKAIKFIKDIDSKIIVMVDNCYGEFVDKIEPTQVGADIIAGSMIKNPGGGIAPTGGYVCGRANFVDLIAGRLTAPSIGMEVGSYNAPYTPFYQGLFLAPHTVANAMKGNILFGKVFNDLGYETMPLSLDMPRDIIRSIKFDTAEQLISFCRSIQEASPVDSHVTPYPWAMPGYEDEVIMAAGAFVQGASIELSADSPLKAPYVAYLQGGLTYEHVKIALVTVLSNLGY